jgi:hypothetical protein
MPRILAPTLFALSIVFAGCASGFRASPHYSAVTRHLDVGGDVLLYADVEGDLASAADYLDTLLAKLSQTYDEPKLQRLKAKHILKQLGLDQILALGLSSARDGKVFHNKAFLQYGQERRGLLLLTGTPPRALEVAAQAPADVDVAFESDLKIKSLVDLAQTIANDISPRETQEMFAGLDEKLPGTSLPLRELLAHLDTRVVGLLRIDEQRRFPWPGEEVVLPGFDLLVSADALGLLFDAYQGVLRGLPNVTSSVEGDLQWLELTISLPGAEWLRPVLAKNLKTGRLFLATNKAFVKEFLAAKSDGKLFQAADFARATARFPAKANALGYLSSGFAGKLARFLRPLGKDDKDTQIGIDIALDLLPPPGMPFATLQANLPDGLYHV